MKDTFTKQDIEAAYKEGYAEGKADGMKIDREKHDAWLQARQDSVYFKYVMKKLTELTEKK